jgi:hypothetical protein
MSSAVQQRPVWIYATEYKGAAHPVCASENEARLKEHGIEPSRIVKIPDYSYLGREIEKVQKAALILVGGSFNHLCYDLQHLRESRSIHDATGDGKLNVWGQCAGAMILCDRYEGAKEKNDGLFGLLPLTYEIPAYPQKKYAYEGGDNRKLSKLTTGIENGSYASSNDGIQGEKFISFWNEGPLFRSVITDELLRGEVDFAKPLTHYTDTPGAETEWGICAIAEATGLYGKGRVIASAIHLEVADVDVPGEKDSIERLKTDKVRLEQLKKRYELLDIQKTVQ